MVATVSENNIWGSRSPLVGINWPIFLITPLNAVAEKRYSSPVEIFLFRRRGPLPAQILAGQRREGAPMNYDSLYPTFCPAAQARNRLGWQQRERHAAAMPGL